MTQGRPTCFNAFFALIFTEKVSWDHVANRVYICHKKVRSKARTGESRLESTQRSQIFKSDWPQKLRPTTLKKLSGTILRSLAFFENSWRSSQVPEQWKKTKPGACFQKGKEEESRRNFRQINLRSCLGKIPEHTIRCLIATQEKTRKCVTAKMDLPKLIVSSQNN